MQLTKNVHALKINFKIPIGPEITLDRFVYSYFIFGKRITLIDSGVKGSAEAILHYLKSQNRQADEIEQLILTHAHPDHIGAASTIKANANCPICAHPAARAWIENVDLQFSERPVPGFHSLVEGSVKIDTSLNEGDVIKIGDEQQLEIIHTPGHSKGSIALFLHGENVLFTADSIPNPGDLPIYDDIQIAVNSIRKLAKIDNINFLLSSWDTPHPAAEVEQVFSKGIGYLQKIHDVIREIASGNSNIEPMALCAQVVSQLGLPPAAINPLVARSFISHLKILDRERL